ncbi:MAG: hypothetical protein ACKVXR_17790 [Planctomycetota bacterium]
MKAPQIITAILACSLASQAGAQMPTPVVKGTLPGGKASQVSAAYPGGSGGQALLGPNDLCSSATPIAGPGTYPFDNVGANTDGSSICGNIGADVWFDFTALSTTPHRIQTCGLASFDTVIAVYSTAACVGAPLVCNDDSCASLQSSVTISATAASVYKIRIGGRNAATGTGSFSVTELFPPANDFCSAPVLISGAGPHSFDNSAATTGSEGQAEILCAGFANGIGADLWYRWTAGYTGTARISTCGQTLVDTKIAVYPGTPSCPVSGSAISCNDDNCGLQSKLDFSCTNGSTYTIQVGSFPGATPGPGTFTIGPPPVAPPNDDCSTPTLIAGRGPHNFNSVDATTGTQGQAEALCSGTGIENDLWFKWTATATGNATLTTCGTTAIDTKVAVYPGSPNCPIAGSARGCNDDNCGGVQTAVCWGATNGVSYIIQVGNFPGASGGAGQFNISIGSSCTGGPMVQSCFPGTGGVISCPCGQPANASGGCANYGAGSTTGAVLNATGTPDVSADTLLLTASNHRQPAQGVLNVFFSYKPGGATPTTGNPSGAGVRCIGAGGSLKRLYTVQCFGGTVSKPGMGDQSVSARSAAFTGHAIVPPETRHYFNVYRDGQAAGPCGNTATSTNLTNMGSVLWSP